MTQTRSGAPSGAFECPSFPHQSFQSIDQQRADRPTLLSCDDAGLFEEVRVDLECHVCLHVRLPHRQHQGDGTFPVIG